METVRNERGSVIIFATLIIVVLLIMVGIGLDTGQLTYTRNQGQAAVDAAALAAVSGLPSRNATEVENRAKAFNATNNYVGSGTASHQIQAKNVSYVQYDFTTNTITNYAANINNANGVRVALEEANGGAITTPVFLTPLLNWLGMSVPGTNNINVSAVATIIETPAIPIAIWNNVCPAFDSTTIRSGVKIEMQHPDQKTNGLENSCWTTFLDCSSGAPDIKAGFKVASTCSGNSIDGPIDIGTPICQNRGQVNTVMTNAQQFFLPDKGQWWLVPVIGGGANCDPTNPTVITHWAKIHVTDVVKQGSPKYLTADVVCGGEELRQDLTSSLCFSHKLVREPTKGM